jgi:hypothetical protein
LAAKEPLTIQQNSTITYLFGVQYSVLAWISSDLAQYQSEGQNVEKPTKGGKNDEP